MSSYHLNHDQWNYWEGRRFIPNSSKNQNPWQHPWQNWPNLWQSSLRTWLKILRSLADSSLDPCLFERPKCPSSIFRDFPCCFFGSYSETDGIHGYDIIWLWYDIQSSYVSMDWFCWDNFTVETPIEIMVKINKNYGKTCRFSLNPMTGMVMMHHLSILVWNLNDCWINRLVRYELVTELDFCYEWSN